MLKATLSGGTLSVLGDGAGNTLVASRNAGGTLFVNGGAVPVTGGTPTILNTAVIQMSGQGGNDTLTLDESRGALPHGILNGGAGNDLLTGGSGADQLIGQSGNDTLNGKAGNDVMTGGDGNDVLSGGAGNDQVFGQGGDDRIAWGAADGNDAIDGGAGVDTLDIEGAGSGTDEVFTLSSNGGDRVRLDRGGPAPAFLDVAAVENLVVNLNGGNDSITIFNAATPLALTIGGGSGNDSIRGGNGAEHLSGGEGNDFIDGNIGNDTVRGGGGNDLLQWDPGDGSDLLDGNGGDDTMIFNGSNIGEAIEIFDAGGHIGLFRNVAAISLDINDVEHLVLNTLGSADTIVIDDLGATDRPTVQVNLAGFDGLGDAAADTVVANATAGDDVIEAAGTAARTEVTGLASTIAVTTIEAGLDRVAVNLGAGEDAFDGSAVTDPAVQLAVSGGEGDDLITGGAGNDVLSGDAGDDVIIGGAGNDTIDGGAGDDVIIGGAGFDTIILSSGDDVVIQDFAAGAARGDRIDLSAVAPDVDFAWIRHHAHQAEGGTELDLGHGTEITLGGVDPAMLAANDFLLG